MQIQFFFSLGPRVAWSLKKNTRKTAKNVGRIVINASLLSLFVRKNVFWRRVKRELSSFHLFRVWRLMWNWSNDSSDRIYSTTNCILRTTTQLLKFLLKSTFSLVADAIWLCFFLSLCCVCEAFVCEMYGARNLSLHTIVVARETT